MSTPSPPLSSVNEETNKKTREGLSNYIGVASTELIASVYGVSKGNSLEDYINVPPKSSQTPAELLTFTTKSLKYPLTEECKEGERKTLALKSFTHLQQIMGDRKYKSLLRRIFTTRTKPPKDDPLQWNFELIRGLVAIGIKEPHLRNELYLQAMRQVTKNPKLRSQVFGWEVLCIYASKFPPSKDLISVLIEHLKKENTSLDNVSESQLQSLRLSQRTSPRFDDEEQVKNRIYFIVKYIKIRMAIFLRTSPVLEEATRFELENIIQLPFNDLLFGLTLPEIMNVPANRDDSGLYPKILSFLCESILKLKGYKSEGIFRESGSAAEMRQLRFSLERGIYDIGLIVDPAVPASLLKIWLRELGEPIIPNSLYHRCLLVDPKDDGKEAMAIFSELSGDTRPVLEYLINFLQVIGQPKYQKQTKMSLRNLSIVFGPTLLRCPSRDPLSILANAHMEEAFMESLLLNYHSHQ